MQACMGQGKKSTLKNQRKQPRTILQWRICWLALWEVHHTVRSSSVRMLQHWVQGGCCPFARSSQFLQVVEGAGRVRSAGREPVGTMQSSLVSQGSNPRLWCCLSFGREARSLALCKVRWTRWLCACCLWVPALTSRGSVCLDIAVLWDVTHPSLFSPGLWGLALKQLPNAAYTYFAFVASCVLWVELQTKHVHMLDVFPN